MQNIVLVGFMGTGKTTVGKQLSKATNMPLVDMDALIEERAKKSINDIFLEDGEPHFRKLEREIVQELSSKSGQVISTGGGIVLNNDNITDFEATGFVTCLLASAEEIMERLQGDTTRPLLAGDKKDNILKLLADRRPLYEAISHSVETTGLSPEAIADQILAEYQSNNS